MDREQQTKHAEDQLLVLAFNGGDAAAFDRLVLKYKDLIYTLCYRFFGDHEEANDCAQETFIKVYRALKGFKGDASFSTWIYTIALNTCRNRRSSLAYRLKKSTVGITTEKETDDGVLVQEIADTAAQPAQEVERQETESMVQKAISLLDETQRAIILLRDIQGLSYEEIASATGYELGTVKSKLSRAREQLKQNLKGVVS